MGCGQFFGPGLVWYDSFLDLLGGPAQTREEGVHPERLPWTHHPIVKGIYHMEHVRLTEIHLSLLGVVVVEVGSEIKQNNCHKNCQSILNILSLNFINILIILSTNCDRVFCRFRRNWLNYYPKLKKKNSLLVLYIKPNTVCLRLGKKFFFHEEIRRKPFTWVNLSLSK